MVYKKLIRNSLFAGLLIVILNIALLEVFTRQVLIPNDVIYRKEKLLVEQKNQIKMVSLGDSHVERGLDMDRKDFFNFSIANEPVPLWYFKAKWLVKNAENLELLLLPMDYHIFSYYRTANIEHVTRQYKDYIDERVNPELGYYPDPGSEEKFPLYSLQTNYAPIVYRSVFEFAIGAFDRPRLTRNGTSTRFGTFGEDSPEKRMADTRKRVDEHLYSRFLVHPEMVGYYEKIIELAKSKGIEVVLVRYPLSKEYLSLVTEEAEAEFSKAVEFVESRHDVKILDYRRIFDGKQEFFKDHDHLNDEGAKSLGIRVVRDLGLE